LGIRVAAIGPSRAVGLALGLLLVSALVPPPAEAAAAIVVYHGSRLKPYIALTIDDGYSPANCRRIADILQRAHVPATYFPYGKVFGGSPSTWRYISARFPVANHTYSHPVMTRLSYSSQLWEIQKAQQRFRTVTGRKMAPLLRPPYGAYNMTTRRAAAAAGVKYLVMWDTSFADTATASDAAHLRAATRGTKGSIILLHCGPASTVRILPKVIATYKARGLKFVTVQQLLGLPSGSPTPAPSPTASPTASPSPWPSQWSAPTDSLAPSESPDPTAAAETTEPAMASEPAASDGAPTDNPSPMGSSSVAGASAPGATAPLADRIADRGGRRTTGHDPPLL
jgi:peptidoglycan/xylan/chitin deacetylase (PgdA/CDA1 family)